MLAFQTIAASVFKPDVQTILEHFEENSILKNGLWVELYPNIYRISSSVTTLPQWSLPIVHEKLKAVLVDPRMFIRETGLVSKEYELANLYNRAILEREWFMYRSNYHTIAAPVVGVYAEWLTAALSRRYVMNELQKSVSFILFSFYAWSSIFTGEELDRMSDLELVDQFSVFMGRRLNVKGGLLDDLLKTDTMKNFFHGRSFSISNVCSLLSTVIDSPAIKVTRGVLMELVAQGSWAGHDALLISTAAVEHLPLVVHMTYGALRSGMMRKTKVGMAVEAVSRRGIDMKSVARTINSFQE